MRFAQLPGALVLAATVVLSPWPVHTAPVLRISPASGVYAASQRVDLAIVLQELNGLAVVGGEVKLDENDITPVVATVFRPEPLAGGIAFRSINLPMGVLGLGTHSFEVTLSLSDGSRVTSAVLWQVLR